MNINDREITQSDLVETLLESFEDNENETLICEEISTSNTTINADFEKIKKHFKSKYTSLQFAEKLLESFELKWEGNEKHDYYHNLLQPYFCFIINKYSFQI